MIKTQFEVKIHELTSNSKKLPIMEEIEDAVLKTFYEKQCDIFVKHICRKLQENPKKWFKIYKALLISEVCLKKGSQRCIRNLQLNLYLYENLKKFQFEEKGIDRGHKIREYSTKIYDELQNLDINHYSPCIAQKMPKDFSKQSQYLRSKSTNIKSKEVTSEILQQNQQQNFHHHSVQMQQNSNKLNRIKTKPKDDFLIYETNEESSESEDDNQQIEFSELKEIEFQTVLPNQQNQKLNTGENQKTQNDDIDFLNF